MAYQQQQQHDVFGKGDHSVRLIRVEEGLLKPLEISFPEDQGEYPVVFLCHGYMLLNSHYSELAEHVASHGFIVVAPQMYCLTCSDATQGTRDAAAVVESLSSCLEGCIARNSCEQEVRPRLEKLALVGHSRGGKVAFGIALGLGSSESTTASTLQFSAVVGLDAVDGGCLGCQTSRASSINHVQLVGTGLGSQGSLPCAPERLGHDAFFHDCPASSFHFVAPEYGHMDFLNDRISFARSVIACCSCKNGPSRAPMRTCAGGLLVAFLQAALLSQTETFQSLLANPSTAPAKLNDPEWHIDAASNATGIPDLNAVFSDHYARLAPPRRNS